MNNKYDYISIFKTKPDRPWETEHAVNIEDFTDIMLYYWLYSKPNAPAKVIGFFYGEEIDLTEEFLKMRDKYTAFMEEFNMELKQKFGIKFEEK